MAETQNRFDMAQKPLNNVNYSVNDESFDISNSQGVKIFFESQARAR